MAPLSLHPTATLSCLHRADGSASFTHNSTQILASVNGPMEIRARDGHYSKAVLEIIVRPSIGVGENTKDPIYIDAERRFSELEKETKKLHDDSFLTVSPGMLSSQIGFSQAIAEIYKPISGGIKACEQYQQIVEELKASLAPEHEMIETRIIRPADELMEVIRLFRKTATKRDHKQLDYDQHRATHKKLQEKKERTLKDEKALYAARNSVELATLEFNTYNDLLKTELPKLFELEREFIRPLFQSFYYMQLNVFYTLHERMQSLNIPYFDLSNDIEAAFQKKRGDVQEQAEGLTILHFKTVGQKASRIGTKFNKYGKREEEVTKLGPEPEAKPGMRRKTIDSFDTPPPAYQAVMTSSDNKLLTPGQLNIGRSNSTGSTLSTAGKPKPPLPKPKPKSLAVQAEKATAMYDFEAQVEGDLGFKAGDVIEIVQRTSNENEWWTGKLRGVTGQIPGNYVKSGS
ncbi:BAR-domain-containing protein [Terfezia boudieri ATCC MYA-4762]|uniref:BAR-domain-containing protein n=1 Tax=Terfezia boudieri ATCC MYA-4762 TaxID=1051890 RepID=A0A3N4LSS9_9PEZI|nr:BAR-domain-containing protein [Terfezia boudieri ATCC MYA-4762]